MLLSKQRIKIISQANTTILASLIYEKTLRQIATVYVMEGIDNVCKAELYSCVY
jgi:hypothetical protein